MMETSRPPKKKEKKVRGVTDAEVLRASVESSLEAIRSRRGAKRRESDVEAERSESEAERSVRLVKWSAAEAKRSAAQRFARLSLYLSRAHGSRDHGREEPTASPECFIKIKRATSETRLVHRFEMNGIVGILLLDFSVFFSWRFCPLLSRISREASLSFLFDTPWTNQSVTHRAARLFWTLEFFLPARLCCLVAKPR